MLTGGGARSTPVSTLSRLIALSPIQIMLTCTFSMMPSHSAASLLYSSKSEVELLFADSLASLLQDSFRFQNLRYFLTDADNSSSSSNSDSDTSSSDARDEEGRRVNGLAEEAEGERGRWLLKRVQEGGELLSRHHLGLHLSFGACSSSTDAWNRLI